MNIQVLQYKVSVTVILIFIAQFPEAIIYQRREPNFWECRLVYGMGQQLHPIVSLVRNSSSMFNLSSGFPKPPLNKCI